MAHQQPNRCIAKSRAALRANKGMLLSPGLPVQWAGSDSLCWTTKVRSDLMFHMQRLADALVLIIFRIQEKLPDKSPVLSPIRLRMRRPISTVQQQRKTLRIAQKTN